MTDGGYCQIRRISASDIALEYIHGYPSWMRIRIKIRGYGYADMDTDTVCLLLSLALLGITHLWIGYHLYSYNGLPACSHSLSWSMFCHRSPNRSAYATFNSLHREWESLPRGLILHVNGLWRPVHPNASAFIIC
ncbi:hypothetical protein LIPSTDRAFT_202830 [Lipomyces starkeyi NRRL Y-11557]|uniref:Uncharacterized protein n=1 Tax=Lipomyces starkeyi NRRL Y-11557 TaxID=675824 RepID=A0A1E3PUQ4_LIPST|nr:hypothetical protein LIPSTDRAFT_202830 [Lipomyces starkeyi NRRL Y-11557]